MNNVIMKQCETMIDALENADISIEVYATEFCNQVALPPLDRCFSELVEALEDKIREENLIAIDTLEQMKWRRYEEWGDSEEIRGIVIDLVNEHPNSYAIHRDAKLLMSKESLRALLEAGYQDCTSHNDETPSYYDGKRIIYIYNPLNEFKATDIEGEHIGTFNTISEAINA